MTNEEKNLISKIFHCFPEHIETSATLNSMTNRNEIFSIYGVQYVLRSPGMGSNELVNRVNELSTYYHIHDLHVSDDPIYFDQNTGLKITKYINCSHVCDPKNYNDCKLSMKLLKRTHDANIVVPHKIDMYSMLAEYSRLMVKSKYTDHATVMHNILCDLAYLNNTKTTECLVHFDPNPDNILFTKSHVYLLDWEYAGMHEPLVDIAMFAIYSGYSKQEIIELAHLYDACISKDDIKRILTYCAVAGLLWSNWCEYKEHLGIDFGDYAKQQYEYAKEFTGAWKWKL